jgi:hypothetical protein
MTGAEFNKQIANIKMYKVLNGNMVHYGYKYEPNALNDLSKTGEHFNPDPDCKPGGLYFCTELYVLEFIKMMGEPLIAPVEIPADARISIGDHKFKTDKMILGTPITRDEFYSDELLRSFPEEYLEKIMSTYPSDFEWKLSKRVYFLTPDKINDKLKISFLQVSVHHRDVDFLGSIERDVREMLVNQKIEYDFIASLYYIDRMGSDFDVVIEWFRVHFPQNADLLDALQRCKIVRRIYNFYSN